MTEWKQLFVKFITTRDNLLVVPLFFNIVSNCFFPVLLCKQQDMIIGKRGL